MSDFAQRQATFYQAKGATDSRLLLLEELHRINRELALRLPRKRRKVLEARFEGVLHSLKLLQIDHERRFTDG